MTAPVLLFLHLSILNILILMFIKCSLLDSCVEHNWSVVENECLLNFSRMVWVTLLPNIALSISEQSFVSTSEKCWTILS